MADQLTWTAPDDTKVELNDWDNGFFHTGDGTTGLWAPPYEVTAERTAGVDGTVVQQITAVESQPTVGLFLRADTKLEFRKKARALIRAMRPKAGLGVLTVTTDWGDRRSLACYCLGGLEGDMARGVLGPGPHWRMVLRFYAPDPWWYGPERTLRFGLAAPVPFFPIPPVTLSASTVQGQTTVDLSDTDEPSYPVWTVTGPGASLVLQNRTTGRKLTVDVDLAAGETLTVDTRPRQESVRLGDGTNALPLVRGYPDLWPLIDGVNDLTVSLTGTTTDSQIVGVYQPRFSGI